MKTLAEVREWFNDRPFHTDYLDTPTPLAVIECHDRSRDWCEVGIPLWGGNPEASRAAADLIHELVHWDDMVTLDPKECGMNSIIRASIFERCDEC